MDIFEKLKSGEPVDMLSPEYRPAIDELRRADLALFRLNHAEPTPENMEKGLDELFDGHDHSGHGIMMPCQIDFPKQLTIGKHVFINHSFTAMSIGGVTLEDNAQIGPHVTIVTDNHDFDNRYVLKCRGVRVCKNAWIGANVTILPGVTVGENAVIAGGAVVTKDVPASNSISHQIEILTKYCMNHGITNYKIYKDDGYSGTSFKRPGFQKMLADIEAGLVGTVIVKDMSRFGRNYLEVGLYTEIRFPEMGVRFIAINDGVDSENQMDNDFTPFRNIING